MNYRDIEILVEFYEKTKNILPVILDTDSLIGTLPKTCPKVHETVNLPRPNEEMFKVKDMDQIMIKRKSTRISRGEPVNLEVLPTLLYYSVGIHTYISAYGFNKYPLKLFPCVGGLGEIEIYIVPFNVPELRKFNVYQYNVMTNSLENVSNEERYGTREARFVFIDCGVVVENFYIVGTALRLGIVALGGLDDNIIEKANDINPYTDKEIPVIGILTGIPGE